MMKITLQVVSCNGRNTRSQTELKQKCLSAAQPTIRRSFALPSYDAVAQMKALSTNIGLVFFRVELYCVGFNQHHNSTCCLLLVVAYALFCYLSLYCLFLLHYLYLILCLYLYCSLTQWRWTRVRHACWPCWGIWPVLRHSPTHASPRFVPVDIMIVATWCCDIMVILRHCDKEKENTNRSCLQHFAQLNSTQQNIAWLQRSRNEKQGKLLSAMFS